jgi:hypothetical protein
MINPFINGTHGTPIKPHDEGEFLRLAWKYKTLFWAIQGMRAITNGENYNDPSTLRACLLSIDDKIEELEKEHEPFIQTITIKTHEK